MDYIRRRLGHSKECGLHNTQNPGVHGSCLIRDQRPALGVVVMATWLWHIINKTGRVNKKTRRSPLKGKKTQISVSLELISSPEFKIIFKQEDISLAK